MEAWLSGQAPSLRRSEKQLRGETLGKAFTAIKSNVTDLKPSKDRFKKQIKLLSGGKVNENHFPGGQITIYPWDYKVDEWIQKRQRSGIGSTRSLMHNLLPMLCNLNGCPPDKFIASEVLTVMMVSRSILLNDKVSFDYACPGCKKTGAGTVKVPDELERLGEKPETWPGFDIIVLPDCKDSVKVRPLTVGDEISIDSRTDLQKSRCGEAAAKVIAGVVSINDTTADKVDELIQWFESLPPGDQNHLIREFDKLQPQLSTDIHLECNECGKQFDYTLRLDPDFFR
jgi:hypothetical protein